MAQFKTGYLQRTVPMDVAVAGTVGEGVLVTSTNRNAAILRGDLVILVPANGDKPAYIKKADTLANATHMVALTDMTIGGGHVPTDLKDYRPSDLVGATRGTVAVETPILATDKTKKVGLWPLWDKDDIVLDGDGNDLLE